MAYLDRIPVSVGKESHLATLRLGYLFQHYKDSLAAKYIRSQDPIMVGTKLGEQASQLSEYMDLLKHMDHLGLITEEQAAVIARLREALSFLRGTTPDMDRVRTVLSPDFAARISPDKASVMDLIREKSSGRNGFITNFFAHLSLAISHEYVSERFVELSKLLKELFACESPVTDEWMEAYQARNREGVVLTLDPLTINLILLHALRTATSERTPAFSQALRDVVAFIRRRFIEAEGEVAGWLAQDLKRDSYPETLLSLVESGGNVMGLYAIQNGHDLAAVIRAFGNNASSSSSHEGQLHVLSISYGISQENFSFVGPVMPATKFDLVVSLT
jgi:hypothetical protein